MRFGSNKAKFSRNREAPPLRTQPLHVNQVPPKCQDDPTTIGNVVSVDFISYKKYQIF